MCVPRLDPVILYTPVLWFFGRLFHLISLSYHEDSEILLKDISKNL